MAEVFAVVSAVQATTQLIEQAFRIFGRLRKAHQRQKALVEVLARHERELSSIKVLIGIIEDVNELQTPAVGTELRRLNGIQSNLAAFLTEIDPRQDPKSRSKVSQFARQLTQGSADEAKLNDIMNELAQVKASLLLRIQVSNVGVMGTMERQLVANAEVIQRIDQFLREEIDECQGLRIARLLKGRRPSNDGTVPLTPADLRSLSQDTSNDRDDGSEDEKDSAIEMADDDSASPRHSMSLRTERIILRNTARHQAIQINAALGEDIWRDLGRLVVKDNIAEGNAMQLNYGVTAEMGLKLLAIQGERIAAQGK